MYFAYTQLWKRRGRPPSRKLTFYHERPRGIMKPAIRLGAAAAALIWDRPERFRWNSMFTVKWHCFDLVSIKLIITLTYSSMSHHQCLIGLVFGRAENNATSSIHPALLDWLNNQQIDRKCVIIIEPIAVIESSNEIENYCELWHDRGGLNGHEMQKKRHKGQTRGLIIKGVLPASVLGGRISTMHVTLTGRWRFGSWPGNINKHCSFHRGKFRWAYEHRIPIIGSRWTTYPSVENCLVENMS